MTFNRSLVFLGSCVLISAVSMNCGGGKESDSSSTETCTISIESYPAADASDFYYRSAIEFYLSEADSSMDPTVTVTAGGTEVAGSTTYSDDKTTVYFTPTSPLQPSTSYTATLTSCRGETSVDFMTSALGAALGGDVDLKAGSYVLDLANARFIQPEMLGSLVQTYLTMNILVGVSSYDTANIDMMGAISTEGTTDQDYCQPTIPFPSADFSQQPYFQVGPADVSFNFEGMEIPIHQLNVSGTFAADGSYFGGGVLGGMADARDIAKLGVADLKDPDVICKTIQTVGATCEACPDGQNYCLSVLADNIKAVHQDATLGVVEQADCHEQCATIGKDCTVTW